MDIDLSRKNINLEYLSHPQLTERNILLGILRLDKIDHTISGNKWFKLKENIQKAIKDNKKNLLTFGGPFSNHLVATAAAAHRYNLGSIGIIRGQPQAPTPTLKECENLGMKLYYVDRKEYALKNEKDYIERLEKKFEYPYIIPEGGNNDLGRKGAGEIIQFLPKDYTDLAIAVGTGTTLSGIYNALDSNIKFHGFSPMKGGAYILDEIQSHLSHSRHSLNLYDRWHFGGFGKYNQELIDFLNYFYTEYRIPLDFVYTGKMLYGIMKMIESNLFNNNSHLICIHTGGLQGNKSMTEFLKFQR